MDNAGKTQSHKCDSSNVCSHDRIVIIRHYSADKSTIHSYENKGSIRKVNDLYVTLIHAFPHFS